MIGRLKRYFLAGILAILPLGLTAWLLFRIFTAIDSSVSPLITRWVGFEIPGLGFAATILFVVLAGLFASNIIGRTIIGRVDQLFAKVPLFSRIYISVKQIGEGLIGGQKNLFERVVFFEYPRRGSWVVGFVTSEHEGVLAGRSGKRYYHVFLPTTPNPTSGFLLVLPAEDLVEAEMSVEEGLKLVVSGGTVAPPPKRRPLPAEETEGGRPAGEPPEGTVAVSKGG